jgi:hypothetical protein
MRMVPTGAQMLLSMLGIDAKKIAELFDAINKEDVLGLVDRIKTVVERIEDIDRRTAHIERAIDAGSYCAGRIGHSYGRSAPDGDGNHTVEATDGPITLVAYPDVGDFHATSEEAAASANREHVR